MCLYPKLIKNRKYTQTIKNSGNIPAVSDIRTLFVPIGCQVCLECRKQKAREWQVRLQEEIKVRTNGKFITLTFSNESYAEINNKIPKIKISKRKNWEGIEITKEKKITGYTRDNQIATYAVRHFLERWRKKYKKSVRHWLITELGQEGTENIHLHGIIWTDKTYDEIEKIWDYGFIWPKKYYHSGKMVREHTWVSTQTVNYMTKYVYKTDQKHANYISIILSSKGIGKNYIKPNSVCAKQNKYNGLNTNETYKTSSGHKISLPIYYRNAIYTEQERENLWLQKLDKEERWVLGTKISIKNGEKEYNQALKAAQTINIKLGYNSPQILWRKEKYEEERRLLYQNKRIQGQCVP